MASTEYRDTHAGDLRPEHAGTVVRLAGWAERIRDQGGVVFVDLRDASGVVQVVFRPDAAPTATDAAHGLRREYCIRVDGTVQQRPEGTVNADLATGAVEVEAAALEILSSAETLPFHIDERTDVDEGRRLRYRYLDLRRPRMTANLRARSTAVGAMRRVMEGRGFLEVETPTLIASTPEGARDFLVPSRLRPGQFYALPQSPQLFKQLLMIGGVERYYQIARCYRDEDFRADRQVEFTQLDFEGAFWGQDEVLETLEEIAVAVTEAVRGIDLSRPFPRLTYAEALARYGTDKPDIRFGMEIVELSDVFATTEFKAFSGVLAAGGAVRGINAGGREMARSALDGLVVRARELGAAGLVWMVVEADGSLRSPTAKFLGEDEQAALNTRVRAHNQGTCSWSSQIAPMWSLRCSASFASISGSRRRTTSWRILFVTDFPVFERTEGGDLAPLHHPFTSPVSVEAMRNDPDHAISKAYDLVLNGSELGSGSVRIHDPVVQAQVFEILGISPEAAQRRFGWFLEALRYGTPPHAGFAIGIDRMVAILQGERNIREVIPFPKTQTGADPLTGSPSRVEDYQLSDLGIDVRPEVRVAWAAEEEAGTDQ